MELKGITAVITGSSGRLGYAITKALAEAGCNCLCHYHRNRQTAEALADQIQKLGVKAMAVSADISRPEQIEALFAEATKLGTPQILINSAAVFSRQFLNQITFEQAQEVLNTNFIAPILTSRAFAKIIKAKFSTAKSVVGKIINITDVGGIRPWSGLTVYCASKAALICATRSLAKELAPGIYVNAVAPGMVTWPGDYDESSKNRQLSLIPAGRIAEPTEIADAVIFLLKNDYMTGQILNVDGGRCI